MFNVADIIAKGQKQQGIANTLGIIGNMVNTVNDIVQTTQGRTPIRIGNLALAAGQGFEQKAKTNQTNAIRNYAQQQINSSGLPDDQKQLLSTLSLFNPQNSLLMASSTLRKLANKKGKAGPRSSSALDLNGLEDSLDSDLGNKHWIEEGYNSAGIKF